MTPTQAEELHPDVFEAMVRYAARSQREEQRAARRARRGH